MLVVDSRCEKLKLHPSLGWPLVNAGPHAKQLLHVRDGVVYVSDDDGETCYPDSTTKLECKSPAMQTLFRSERGTLIHQAVTPCEVHYDGERISKRSRAPVQIARSTDYGKTWSDPQVIFNGYSGYASEMIQTASGRILVPVQCYLFKENRFTQTAYYSDDEGETWTRAESTLDNPDARGHHDGIFEGAVVELRDGELLMYCRTSLDRMDIARSRDDGEGWHRAWVMNDASSSPCAVLSLVSGAILMCFSRAAPQTRIGLYSSSMRGTSATVCSWHREELSLRWGTREADGLAWTRQEIFAYDRENYLSYPRLFERRVGEVWISTAYQGRLAVKLFETEFVRS